MTGPNLFAQFQDDEKRERDLFAEFQAEQFKTARGARQGEEEGKANLVADFTARLQDPNLTAEHKARLQRAIDANKPSDGLFPVREVQPGRGVVSNVARGVAAGIPQGVAGLVDLAGAAINAPFQAAGSEIRPARALRDWAAEVTAASDELFDPQGKAGLAGTFVGSMASGAPGYGKLAQVSGNVISRVAPKLAPIVQRAISGNLLERVAGQTLIEAPLNVLQAATLEGATDQQKALALALGTAGSVAGGLLPGQKGKPLDSPREIKLEAGDAKAAKALTGDRLASRAEEMAKLIAEGDAKRAERKDKILSKRELGRQARAQWAQENPGKSWTRDLSPNDRQRYIDQFQSVGTTEGSGVVPAEVAPVVEQPAPVPQAEIAKQRAEPVMTGLRSTASGDTEYEFQLDNGDIVTVRGQPDANRESFVISFIGSTGGQGSVGHRDVRLIQSAVTGMSGTKSISGNKILGAKRGARLLETSERVEEVRSRLASLEQAGTTGNGPTKAARQEAIKLTAELARLEAGLNDPAVANLQQMDVNPKMLEDMSELALDPSNVGLAVQAMDALPQSNRDFMDRLHRTLRVKADKGIIEAGDIQLLANLDAMDTFRRGGQPDVVAVPKDPAALEAEANRLLTELNQMRADPGKVAEIEAKLDTIYSELAAMPDVVARQIVDTELTTRPDGDAQEITVYHGTQEVFDSPDVEGRMYYVTPDAEFANKFAGGSKGKKGGTPNVRKETLRVKQSEIFSFDERYGKDYYASNLTDDEIAALLDAGYKVVKSKHPSGADFYIVLDKSALDAGPSAKPASGTTASPTEIPPVAPRGAQPISDPLQGTPRVDDPDRLRTVVHDKPLSQVDTTDELDKLKDAVYKQFMLETDNPIPATPDHIADIDALARRTSELHNQAKLQVRPEMAADPASGVVAARPVTNRPKSMSGNEFKTLFKTPAGKLGLEQAQSLLDELEVRTAGMHSTDKEAYIPKMNELRERVTQLSTDRRTEGPLTLHARGEIGGAVAGYMSGMIIGDTDEERQKYAMLGALIGAGAAYGAQKQFKPKAKPSIVPKDVLSSVKNYDEINKVNSNTSFAERARWAYQRLIRSAHGNEKFTYDMLQGKSIPAARDPGKMTSMFGRWIAAAESWLVGKPTLELADGTIVDMPALLELPDGRQVYNAKDISDLVDGDTEGLGKLAAARTAIEIYSNTGRTTPGIDLIEAQRLVQAMPEQYHQAADAMRQMHSNLLYSLVQGGVITQEAAEKMTQEKFYAALERAFGASVGENVDGVKAELIGSPNPVKERTRPSKAPIKNPYETMLANIGRTQRSIEINRIKNAIVDLAEAQPALARQWLKRVDRHTKGPDGKPLLNEMTEARVAALKSDLEITTDDAKALVSAYGGDDLNPMAPTMTVYRDGNLRTYRIRRDMAESMKALQPEEIAMVWDILGVPTSFARAGIVNNPVFIARQAWRDNWQAMANSQHGFVFGLDWIRGFLESANYGKAYQEYVQRGGGHTGFQFRDILSQEKALQTAKTPGTSAIDTAIKRIKTLDIADAWHALVVPMSEAARMGEYLRARGRGVDAVQAVFDAKHVVGNFQQRGAATRGLSLSALFLNPSLQALDQAVFASGAHPFRSYTGQKGFKFGKYTLGEDTLDGRYAAATNYVLKNVAGITIPSILLYAAYKDDQEIRELADSEAGQGFWFYRNNEGEIHKSAKPIFEGQIFGTLPELAFRKLATDDPASADLFAQALTRDAAMNLLPMIGVVAGSLWANKDYNTGGRLAPEGGSPAGQANPNTSIPARVIGQSLSPVSDWLLDHGKPWLSEPIAEILARAMSPAGIDYVVRNLGGTLAQEALRGAGQAIQYSEDGYLPPAVEWPIIRGALVKYPTTSTASLQQFYRDAERIDKVAINMARLSQSDPEGFIQYFEQHQEEAGLVDLYASARRELADMRQAINDMKQAPKGVFQPADIRAFEEEITRIMIEKARLTNDVAKLLQ